MKPWSAKENLFSRANSNIENNPSKWKQRKTTRGTLMSLIAWKISFDKVISVAQQLVQSDR